MLNDRFPVRLLHYFGVGGEYACCVSSHGGNLLLKIVGLLPLRNLHLTRLLAQIKLDLFVLVLDLGVGLTFPFILIQDLQELDGLLMVVEGDQEVRKRVVGLHSLRHDILRRVGIENCLLVLHETLADACSLQEEVVVVSVVLVEHSSDELISVFKLLVADEFIELVVLDLEGGVALHFLKLVEMLFLNYNN